MTALRAEEDSGRMELVLAGIVGRRRAFAGALTGVAAGLLVLWLAETAGFVAGGLPLAGSAYQSPADVSVAAALVGIGALLSQLAATRRSVCFSPRSQPGPARWPQAARSRCHKRLKPL
jgi:ABC-2 type transport system permease protein